jgi:Zn-dependent peptidase ImmA (M78 family)
MQNEIEQKAEDILNESGFRAIPISVEDIAAHYKLQIGKATSTDFSGILIRKDGAALIGINSTDTPRRQRFTIAHEIGHFFLHPTNEVLVDYRRSSKGTHRTPKEREADIFAASLLMPRQELIKDFMRIAGGTLTDEEQTKNVVSLLATKYEVSDEAMNIRLLGLSISEKTK